MAFYRKLTVDNKEYQYHIGQSFVKIKGIPGDNNVPIEKIGFKGIVKPGMISNFIQGKENKVEDFFSSCNCNAPKSLQCVPFDLEIYEKCHYVYWCEECFTDNAMDI